MAADMENCQSNAIQQNSFLSLRWKEVNSPINSGIVNNLKKRKRAIFRGGKIKPWSKQKVVMCSMEGFISPGWAPALTGCSRRSLWRGTTTSGRQSAERKTKCFCPFSPQQVTDVPDGFSSTCPAKIPLRPMMTRMLKTAEPTMVPTPTSPLVMKTPEWGLERRREREDLHFYCVLVFPWLHGR